MKIAILDDVTMTSAQEERLRRHGELTVFTGVPSDPEEILRRAEGAEVVIASWTKLGASVLENLPRLKLISVWATGHDNVDLEAANRLGVRIARVPGYATEAVAELCLGLMLVLARRILPADRDVRREKKLNWNLFEGRELKGKVLGLLGAGAIGRRVAEIALAFGLKILAYDPAPPGLLAGGPPIEYGPLPTVLRESDILSLHVPLTAETKGFFSGREFACLKRGALFINTAREAVVDQEALLEALESGRISGAGLDDVDLSKESGRRLLELEQVVFTPHIGFHTREAVAKKTDICFENVIRFIQGAPENLVAEIPAERESGR